MSTRSVEPVRPSIGGFSPAGEEAAEMVRILYRHFLSVAVATVVIAPVMVAVFWDRGDRWRLLVWLGAILSLTAARAALVRRFESSRPAAEETWRWAWRYAAGAVLAGLIWGLFPWLFFAGASAFQQYLTVLVLSAMVSATATVYAAFLPAHTLTSLAEIGPLALWYLHRGGRDDLILAALLVVFIAAHVWITRRQRSILADAVHQRFHNLELLRAVDSKRREAEQANEAKTRFLAAASHDLRQPMHAMALFSDSLRETLHTDEQRLLHGRMEESIRSVNELLNSLLDISRLDAGIIHSRRQVFDISRLLAGLAQRFRPLAREKGLALETRLDTFRVRSDPVLLENVIRDLLSNAIKYTPRGAVSLGCRRVGERGVVEVLDTGPGIPPELRERVFEEFFQAGNPERDRGKGLGLGLSIVRRLCQLLGHELILEDAAGGGARFVIGLEATDAAADEAWSTRWAGSERLHLKVLVIDDEAAILQGMQRLLEAWDCQVLAAESIDDALALVRGDGSPPDLVIADYRLRGGRTGAEAIESVRRLPGCGAAVGMIITGDTAPERLREAEAAGYLLLHKPVPSMRLRAAIRLVTRGRQAPA